MKIKSLKEFYQFKPQVLPLRDFTLSNDLLQYIFHTRPDKCSFYSSISCDSGDFLLFDCGYSAPNSFLSRCTVVPIESPEELLHQLKELLSVNCSLDLTLSTLVVENVSDFYFSLKLNRNFVFYTDLTEILRDISVKYKCNVIVTSWDNHYERGYNYRAKDTDSEVDLTNESNKGTLDSITYLPKVYMDSFDHVLYKDKRYLRDENKWVLIHEPLTSTTGCHG